ncbi:tRNA (adenosine(37)-N6)-dimethylallyltransferase MiaA [Nitrosomonas sp. H1_AOB3]|uniref:tRNA (adenosine(37)-N6)-dimethylallyltransferase MiaA n=1 Tax=Nitrosomonas sp. H1_AOB3 TaxID=2741553 RepID=UPI001935CB75|nr:tRNA (adenosine(37)-N6)-dimethylallyltransferase MiaA [Nitrosomonas sp. H1_AOB3]QOJ09447.1 MAG: tRNA (adenosine(37)-N6)-dimethylallyltransferase MiaA [Nitrosomonas sp. H1_AOB3]
MNYPDIESPPAIFLMGPTASGKSAMALEIARRFPVEIIGVDSAQVYRFMDIGSAKPDKLILSEIPHHLIDLIDPDENYSAARFREDALSVMREITARGRVPLLVGGTMLYFKVLRQGLAALPPADDSVRRALEQQALDKGWPAMHAVLSQLDPVTAGRIQPNDSQRIQRALEVCYLTGKPMSEMLEQQQNADFPFRVFNIALLPGDRSVLHDRISQRFATMLEAGLIDEVRLIREQFHVNGDMPSMRCVGYRQVCMYLDNEISFARMQETGVFATRQLAKRQLTWLRSMSGLQIFDCLENRLARQIIDFIQAQRLFS